MRLFLDFVIVILSLTVQMNLPLKWLTDHFFVSEQTYKISRGSNISPTVLARRSFFIFESKLFLNKYFCFIFLEEKDYTF